MSASDYVSAVLSAYGDLVAYSVPVAAFIAMCNLGINVIITAFCGGGLKIGGGKK